MNKEPNEPNEQHQLQASLDMPKHDPQVPLPVAGIRPPPHTRFL